MRFPDPHTLRDVGAGADLVVNGDVVRSTALHFGSAGIYVLVGVVALAYWWRTPGDLRAPSIGFFCLLSAIHAASLSGSLPLFLQMNAAAAVMIATVSHLLLFGALVFVLWAHFPEAFRPREMLGAPGTSNLRSFRVRTMLGNPADWTAYVRSFRPLSRQWAHAANVAVGGLVMLVSIAFAVAAPIFGSGVAADLLAIFRWITVLLMVVVAALLLRVTVERRPLAAVTAVGLGLVVAGILHDVLVAGILHGVLVGIDGDRPPLVPFTFLGFVLTQSYADFRQRVDVPSGVPRGNRRRDSLRPSGLSRHRHKQAGEPVHPDATHVEAANHARTDFVAAVTHELRTPLTSMLGYTQLLRDELQGRLEPRHERFFDVLSLSGERLLNLVNDLLDLAKIEAGHVDMELKDVPIRGVVDDVAEQIYPLAQAKNLYVDTEFEEDGLCVRANEERLRHVLTNLVSNAVKFTREGGVKIFVAPATRDGMEAVSVRISDTGPGISPSFVPRLFEPFTREERAVEDGPSGSGLGLSIVQELLSRMDGTATVESNVDEGSTFTVMLPRASLRIEES